MFCRLPRLANFQNCHWVTADVFSDSFTTYRKHVYLCIRGKLDVMGSCMIYDFMLMSPLYIVSATIPSFPLTLIPHSILYHLIHPAFHLIPYPIYYYYVYFYTASHTCPYFYLCTLVVCFFASTPIVITAVYFSWWLHLSVGSQPVGD